MFRLAVGASLALTALAGDACECKNWKELYETRRVLCGEGYEFQHMAPPEYFDKIYFARLLMGEPMYEHACGAFHAQDHNMCVGYKQDHVKETGLAASQWCYVSAECKELNGGQKVKDKKTVTTWIPDWLNKLTIGKLQKFWDENIHEALPVPRDVAVKICDPAKGDKRLRDLHPMKLLQMLKDFGIRMADWTKLAYPQFRDPHDTAPLWEHVRDAFGKGDMNSLPDGMKAMIEKKEPFILEVDCRAHETDTQSNQRIIYGKEIYKVDSKCHKEEPGCFADKWSFTKGRDIGEL